MITYFNSPVLVLKTSDMILIITIFFVLSSSSSHAQAAHNSSCNRVCGTQIRVQYPFGFSPGCEIQLNCSEHVTVQIGDFRVHNITNDNILVNVSAACDRPISTIKQLIRKNYAPTTRNNFLLQNCSKQLKGCFLEASLLEDRLQVKGCQTGSGNISCYLEENRGLKFTTFETLERTGCSSMFTSIAVDLVENRSVNSSGALEIQTLELGWLLQGKCKCVADADCTNVSLDGLQGFRCRCKTGFEGDGFVDGAGCRKGGSKGNKNEKVIISLTVSIGMILLGLSLVVCVLRKNQKKKKQMKQIQEERLKREAEQVQSKERQEEDLELPLLDFDTIAKATNYFSLQNKLGEGGFGPVYKGLLDDGKEIAVKRLSKNSRQGTKEFKNEVVCIAKLQHRNLVKLVGCCIEEEEKMLIYEYLPNRGLDFFIFDETRSKSFGWPTRFNIINGIARGLLYLHQDSRLRVIHRDLKVSNILLDKNLNPKISDFGMARIFGGDENEANTNRVVGTYGYMSPEYQLDGLFSVKSDVFSFGVIVLEIVTGKRNRRFFHPDHHHNLLGHVWNLYKEGKAEELVNKQLGYSGQYESEILRSIHIGLLCLQQDPEDRPNMSYVVMMLGSDIILPQPKQPGFFTERNNFVSDNSSSQNITTATNEVTVSLLDAG